MNEIQSKLKDLKEQVNYAWHKLDIDDKIKQEELLRERIDSSDYWQKTDPKIAGSEQKQLSDLGESIKDWQDLMNQLNEVDDFIDLNDSSLNQDILKKLNEIDDKYRQMKVELRFSGQHDGLNAIINFQAGAGGVDAQDWTQILERMYVRWAEQNDTKMVILEESSNDDGGLKNASALVTGKYAYGKLRSEHGVHRLVGLSPFNSAGSRETSFAMLEVIPQIANDNDIEVDEADLRIDVYRSGGHGGQSVNTTDSAVRITHIPTGIVVSIQNERSQIQNKESAMKILKSRLLNLAEQQHNQKISQLKGPNIDAAWGNQIRTYVMHPYTMVKDLRTDYQTSDIQKVLDGDINPFIDAYLDYTLGNKA